MPAGLITTSLFQNNDPLPLTYFAIFDGHAGTGAALMAANHLHDIIVVGRVDIRTQSIVFLSI